MRLQVILPNTVTLALLSGAVLIGCGPSNGTPPAGGDQSATGTRAQPAGAHDPHDVPLTEEEKMQLRKDTESYADAVAHIRTFRDTIRAETTGGDPAAAHRALDNLDLVLEWLPEIAQKGNVPKSNWEEVNTTAQKLRDLFNAVHANIDDGKDPDYASVSEQIDLGVDALSAIQPAEGE